MVQTLTSFIYFMAIKGQRNKFRCSLTCQLSGKIKQSNQRKLAAALQLASPFQFILSSVVYYFFRLESNSNNVIFQHICINGTSNMKVFTLDGSSTIYRKSDHSFLVSDYACQCELSLEKSWTLILLAFTNICGQRPHRGYYTYLRKKLKISPQFEIYVNHLL